MSVNKKSIGLCIAIYFFLLLYTAPASLLQLFAEKFVPQLIIPQTEGSLWQGEAFNTVVNIDGVNTAIGKVSWELNPLTLLLLSPSVSLTSANAAYDISAELSASVFSGLSVNDLQARLPLSMLEAWYPPVLGGEFFAQVETLDISASGVSDISGQLFLKNIEWLGTGMALPIGDYQGNLSMLGEDVSVEINDVDARLGLRGSIILTPAGQYKVQATLIPKPDLATEISQALKFVGESNNDGSVTFRQNGHLR